MTHNDSCTKASPVFQAKQCALIEAFVTAFNAGGSSTGALLIVCHARSTYIAQMCPKRTTRRPARYNVVAASLVSNAMAPLANDGEGPVRPVWIPTPAGADGKPTPLGSSTNQRFLCIDRSEIWTASLPDPPQVTNYLKQQDEWLVQKDIGKSAAANSNPYLPGRPASAGFRQTRGVVGTLESVE